MKIGEGSGGDGGSSSFALGKKEKSASILHTFYQFSSKPAVTFWKVRKRQHKPPGHQIVILRSIIEYGLPLDSRD